MSSKIRRSSRRTSAQRRRMLRLDGIQAGYDGTQVLWGVTLTAEKCAMTVLIAPNVAGKSTTLKVGIGRALMSKPVILVLDEPSLGLAPKLVSEIFVKTRELREAGLTVLMVEQNAYAALRIADFGYVMQNGHVVKSGPPDQLLDLEELRKAYFAIP